MRLILSICLAIPPLMLLIIAAFGKIIDPSEFGHFVRYFAPDIPISRGVLGLLVACIELSICLTVALSIRNWNRGSPVLLIVFFLFATIILLIARSDTDAPNCNCFGLLQAYADRIMLIRDGIVRNLVCLFCLAISAFTAPSPSADHRRQSGVSLTVNDTVVERGNVGFTVVEVLVTVVIVSLLVAISVPAFGVARTSARRTASLAATRQHAALMIASASQSDDEFPRPAPDPDGLYADDDGDRHPYFAFFIGWARAMSIVGDLEPTSEVFRSPFNIEGNGGSYQYPCVFLAKPEYWRPETRIGPVQWGSNRMSDVAMPSKKGLVNDWHALKYAEERGLKGSWFLSAYCDGSAEAAQRPGPGYPIGDGVFPGSLHYSDIADGLHTLGGVRGVDR